MPLNPSLPGVAPACAEEREPRRVDLARLVPQAEQAGLADIAEQMRDAIGTQPSIGDIFAEMDAQAEQARLAEQAELIRDAIANPPRRKRGKNRRARRTAPPALAPVAPQPVAAGAPPNECAAEPPTVPSKRPFVARESELHALIRRVFVGLGRPASNRAVEDRLMDTSFDKDEIIQEIRDGAIYWRSSRGAEQTMTLKTLYNFLARLRKEA